MLEGSIHWSPDHSVKECNEFNGLSLKDKKQFVSPQPASKTTSVHPLPMPPPSAMTLGPAEVEQPVSTTWPESKASQQGLWRPPECLVGDLQTKGSIDPPPLPWPGITHNGRTFSGCTQPAPSLSQTHPAMQAFPLLRRALARSWGGERTERQASLLFLSHQLF